MYLLMIDDRSMWYRSRASSFAITSAAIVLPVPLGPEKSALTPEPRAYLLRKPQSFWTRGAFAHGELSDAVFVVADQAIQDRPKLPSAQSDELVSQANGGLAYGRRSR